MSAQHSNQPHTSVPLRERLKEYWDNLLWESSEERKEMVLARIAAHQLAMKEGYESPYTDPDNYNSAWQPIIKRQKGD